MYFIFWALKFSSCNFRCSDDLKICIFIVALLVTLFSRMQIHQHLECCFLLQYFLYGCLISMKLTNIIQGFLFGFQFSQGLSQLGRFWDSNNLSLLLLFLQPLFIIYIYDIIISINILLKLISSIFTTCFVIFSNFSYFPISMKNYSTKFNKTFSNSK